MELELKINKAPHFYFIKNDFSNKKKKLIT
jgi:hypothetical protein